MPSPDYEDATQAWGILAANGLMADYQLIAWSGSGVSTYSTADNSHVNATATAWQIKYPTFPEFWPQVDALHNSYGSYAVWSALLEVFHGSPCLTCPTDDYASNLFDLPHR